MEMELRPCLLLLPTEDQLTIEGCVLGAPLELSCSHISLSFFNLTKIRKIDYSILGKWIFQKKKTKMTHDNICNAV
jgi:hypothetical protein